MNILENIKNNKITWSLVLTVLSYIYTSLSENTDILGIDEKTLTIIFLLINVVSFAWDKYVNSSESVFRVVGKHIGTRPPKPPKK